ncbi:MAG: enoyl-CoA hydratase/isomerase family protein [Dehalococcoidia bacterium]|nr:enoyl-CoA hydratase/isomerase family protein [Dehalococcoidia bacterium]
MTAYTTLRLERRGNIAELALARPERGNPVDPRFFDELAAAAAALHDDDSVRAVLLTADGDVFSHGWDTTGEAPEGAPPSAREPLPFRCLELLGPPVIACIEGDAIGAGLELALACDVRIAAEGIIFALPDVVAGMPLRGGGTQRLPRLVGPGVAAGMILLGEPLDPAAALACGLVNRVVPRGQVRAAASRLAERIATQGPLAVRYAKEAMLRGAAMPLDQALRYETDLTVILQTTSDRAEGVRAFLEKRRPEFRGE